MSKTRPGDLSTNSIFRAMSKTTRKLRQWLVSLPIPAYLALFTILWMILGSIIEFAWSYFEGNPISGEALIGELPKLAITGFVWSIAMRIIDEYRMEEEADSE